MADLEASASRFPPTEDAAAGCGHWTAEAGPFVLGALSHEEREQYQAHLSGCQHCRDELARMIGVRALLGRLGDQAWANVAAQVAGQPLPLAPSRRGRRVSVRRHRVAMLSAAVVMAAGCLAVAVAPVVARRPEPAQAVLAVMRPVATPGPMYALLTLEPVANGSRISLVCAWSDVVAHTNWRLRLTVTSTDHRSLPVAEWTATPDVVQPISAWADLDPSHIARVDVSRDAGALLLTFQS